MTIANSPEVQAALEQLASQLQNRMKEDEIPGLSASVVYDQETIWADGFGYANRETQTPATADTPYRIASITKVFTTTMMMHLRDAGKLRLDDPVTRYLPEYQPRSPFSDSPPTTLRQLASHTSGLPANAPGIGPATTEYPSDEEFLAMLKNIELVLLPGSEIKYSNLGLTILGHVLARAAGQSYAQYLIAQIIQPLGMGNSGLHMDKETLARAAISHVPEGMPFPATRPDFDSRSLAPAEQMHSTVNDIARFIALQFRDGDNPAGGAQIIAGSSVREMHAPVALAADWRTGLGLGFALGRVADHAAVWATGGYIGYGSNITMIPELKLGVAIFINSLAAAEEIGKQSIELLIPAVSAAIQREEEILPAPADWQRYVGFYAYPGHPGVDVTIARGKLVMTSRYSGNVYRYVPHHEHIFRGAGGLTAGELLRFDVGPDDRALRADTGNEVFERMPAD
jgi:D-alanyl-D-alanine carboxypeptidase